MDQGSNRTKKSMRNIAFTMMGSVATMLLQLINRKVFVHYLASDYLGLNGLFSNILSMLALSELGVGTAMIFALYTPVAEGDKEKIKSLMQFYKRMYTIIGSFVLVAGVALTPFLKYLIKDMPDIPYIHIYYILYVIDSAVSYFYTYKRSLILCHQEDYISATTQMCSSIGARLGQLLILLFTHNYMLFLICQICFTRLENVVISKIADKKYPYLLEKDIKPLDGDTRQSIKKNIIAMMAHKIGNVIVLGTDNLIISKILGLSVLGVFSNYYLIIQQIEALLNKVFAAVTSSLGNLIAEKGPEEVKKTYDKMLFINFWFFSFCAVCFWCLMQPFIRNVWLGDKYLLSDGTVWALVGAFYFQGMRVTTNNFKTAAGLFWNDRYKPIIESVINIAASIPLTYFLGVAGVKLGTIISMLACSFWIEAFVLHRDYFKTSIWGFVWKQVKFALLTLVMCIAISRLCRWIDDGSVLSFVYQCVLCGVLPNLILFVLYHKTEEFRFFWNLTVGRILNRSKGSIS